MAAQATSIADLLYQISQADVNNQGLVAWDGTNGLQQITENLTASLGARGILYFNSTSQMALAGGSDSGYAVCKTTDGMSFYKFFPNIDNTVVGGIASSSSGQWRPIFAISNTTKYITSLSLTITSGDTGTDIPLGVTFPSNGYAVLIEPTNLYAATTLKNIGWFVTGKTTTQFRIAYASAIVTGGTLEANVLVII